MFVKKRREDLEKEGTNMPRKLISFEWKAIDPDTKKVAFEVLILSLLGFLSFKKFRFF